MSAPPTNAAPDVPLSLTVNGEPRELPAGLTVAGLLEELGVPARGSAVERNRELVPRRQHADTPLCSGDRIEIVTLVGGG
ncbi:sulfur carrier protein ThiS [Alienimonas sp. DA493]|uniref:sulfur carrier protein ThiS n=1 Tax=Alienimonas sp. DA493 TaxID=3373605 RepID=UPI003754726C